MSAQNNYNAEIALFKKKLKQLESFKGRHTELISQYIPYGTDRSTVMNQLNEEINQSSNIKSPTTRKNVQGALRKIIVLLKNINFKLPENGVAIFSGNVSEVDGRSDIKLFMIQPPKELKTKLYWCDSSFHLDPLKEMNTSEEHYAILVIDKGESTIASLSGKNYRILGQFTSQVPGKTRAGGQCLALDTKIVYASGEIKNIENVQEQDLIKSVDFETGKSINTRITKKWLTLKPMLTIKTKHPQFHISCSPDHTFFVHDNGAIIEKPASELTTNTTLLFNEQIQTSTKEVAIETCLYNSYQITSEGKNIIINNRKINNLTQKELAKKTNLTQTAISTIELGKRNSRKKTIETICKTLNLNEKEFIQTKCKKTDSQKLPTTITTELAQFIGYFEGDGSFEEERLNLFDSDEKLIKYYENITKKLFNANTHSKFREKKNYYTTRIYGKQIVQFIKTNFPEITGALNSEIPKKILTSNNEILASFLKGLFDAEGYVTKKEIGLGINNKKLAEQTQISLLRLGIISSLVIYDNNRNPYSKNNRYTIKITGNYSLTKFQELINFNSNQKKEKLDNTIKIKSEKDQSRQILATGSHVKRTLLENNNPLKKFYDINMYLNNKRNISKEIFKKQIINNANEQTKKELQTIYDYKILPTSIIEITKNEKQAMIDISTENKCFIANGLIVHNSSQRFERLREEAMQDFFKRIANKFNAYFLDDIKNLKGVIIGGPGMTKQYFIDKEAINHELAKKIIGIIDTSYTDEGGIREIVQKSEDLLKDTELMQEKIAIDNFLYEIAKNGLATYGQKEVDEALEQGRVAKLIISEEIPWIVIKKKCTHCNEEEYEIIKTKKYDENKLTCKKCDSRVEVIEENDFLEYAIEKANSTGAGIQVVSNETAQGQQFLNGFGGIGAILRY